MAAPAARTWPTAVSTALSAAATGDQPQLDASAGASVLRPSLNKGMTAAVFIGLVVAYTAAASGSTQVAAGGWACDLYVLAQQ